MTVGDRATAARALDRDADALAGAAEAMAGRFRRGGRLAVLGVGRSAAHTQHVAMEFVHPVIVGKRALPAFALTNDLATVTSRDDGFAHQVAHLRAPDDIALGLFADGPCPRTRAGLQAAHHPGLLTLALVGPSGDLADDPSIDHRLVAGSDDPLVAREVHVTAYHVLWELVHLFLERDAGDG